MTQRTKSQNNSMHMLFQAVADTLNDSGIEMEVVLKTIDVPWNKITVKEIIWRSIQKKQLLKQSTTQLDTKNVNEVYETFNRYLAKWGVSIPFPSINEQLNKER